jgi:DNA mismatch repair ATPase MutS
MSIERTPLTVAAARAALRARDPNELLVDEQTFRDLEIFEGEGGAPSLFDLCNLTRTLAGAKVLRGRMRRPWCAPERILAVQQSILGIQQHRTAFEALPGEHLVASIERYFHSGLPLLSTPNRAQFFLEALELRFGDMIKYWRIVEGVLRTADMLHGLRGMFQGQDLSIAAGDVAPWLAELRTLVDRPAFAALPAHGTTELSFQRALRLDRVFRLDERPTIERILLLIPQIDALVAMADATRKFGFIIPEVAQGPLQVLADDVYHPFVESAVANPLRLDQQHRLLFLTGPNMAGKTTYLRACGMALYLAHLGMGVPARSLRFSPAECLFSAITLSDNVRAGISFFRAEALRVRAIAQALADRHRVIALLDEPFKGTNVKDALDASRAVILRFAAKQDSLFMISSHLIELGDAMAATGQVDCRHFEATEREGRLVFDFTLRPGVSSQRLGVRVLEEEGVFDLLDAD